MSLNYLFAEIESYEFAARLNVASGLKLFLRAASAEESVSRLLDTMDDIENCSLVLQRIMELFAFQPDPRYENPKDVALAVYLWLLKIKRINHAEIGAEIISRIPQCWWAKQISQGILERSGARNAASPSLPSISELIKMLQHVNTTTDPYKSAEVISPAGLITALLATRPTGVRIISAIKKPQNRNSDSTRPMPSIISHKYDREAPQISENSLTLDVVGFLK